MAKQRHTAEQIISKLREAEVELAKGLKAPQVCKKLEVVEQTYCRWRKEYGGLCTDKAKRLQEFEKENARLKKLLVEPHLTERCSKRWSLAISESAPEANLFSAVCPATLRPLHQPIENVLRLT